MMFPIACGAFSRLLVPRSSFYDFRFLLRVPRGSSICVLCVSCLSVAMMFPPFLVRLFGRKGPVLHAARRTLPFGCSLVLLSLLSWFALDVTVGVGIGALALAFGIGIGIGIAIPQGESPVISLRRLFDVLVVDNWFPPFPSSLSIKNNAT